MAEQQPDRRQLAYFVGLAQVGLEMAAPAGVGLLLDNYLGWQPWGVIVGAVLGLVAGLVHLVALSQRFDKISQDEQRPE
jgi:F0F1-type ATP synthase assembly protein I